MIRNHFKRNILLAVEILVTSLFLFSGCFFYPEDNSSGSDDNTSNVTPEWRPGTGNKNESDVIDGSYSSDMKNLLLHIDFDDSLPNKAVLENGKYTKDMLFFNKWANPARADGALKSGHGNVCQLNGTGSESYFQLTTFVNGPAVLNFQIKSDMYYDDLLRVAVDNKVYKVPHKGNGDTWKSVTLKIEPGYHTFKWFIPKQNGYSPNLKNIIYIDNITIVNDKIEYIDIYPKGLQETYTDGTPIQFTALPLRGDRSVIKGKTVKYSVDGCGNIDSNGLFTPTSKGRCTLTATIDGKTVRKSDIIVHGRDYLSDTVKIGNYTFTGNVSSPSGARLDTPNTTYSYPQSPMGINFNADGFFVLQGTTKVPLYINVLKDGTDYETNYFVRQPGKFSKRIWLRFGSGKYIVNIAEAPGLELFNTEDKRYEGDLKYTGNCPIVKKLTVINTNQISTEDAIFIMPSEVVQSDSFAISNIAHSILADLPSNASTGDKLKAFHNWELYNHHYDMVSVNHTERRKRQDAEHVIKYGMGVCEGYSNLYAALLRNSGIPAKVICSTQLMHAWNHVLYNGSWYLVDVTWDDPVTSNSDSYNDKAYGRENYTYFLTTHTDSKHTDSGFTDGRSAIEEKQIPEMTGLPNGWY